MPIQQMVFGCSETGLECQSEEQGGQGVPLDDPFGDGHGETSRLDCESWRAESFEVCERQGPILLPKSQELLTNEGSANCAVRIREVDGCYRPFWVLLA